MGLTIPNMLLFLTPMHRSRDLAHVHWLQIYCQW